MTYQLDPTQPRARVAPSTRTRTTGAPHFGTLPLGDPTGGADGIRWREQVDGKQLYPRVVIDRNVSITMSDGVVLRATVIRPANRFGRVVGGLDVLDAMEADMGKPIEGVLRVDGGMSASRFAMQFLADITGAPVDRPPVLETTAMGAAWLAGQAIGIYPDAETFASGWSAEMRFDPKMDPDLRADRYAAWKDAVRRTLTRG